MLSFLNFIEVNKGEDGVNRLSHIVSPGKLAIRYLEVESRITIVEHIICYAFYGKKIRTVQ